METRQAARFKGVLFLGVGLLVGVLVASVFLFSFAPGGLLNNPPPATGKTVPEFSLRTVQGGEVKLADLQGKPVVINFWATWCPPCREEMPMFEKMARSLQGKVVFLAVDYDEDLKVVADYVRQNGLSLPILLDPGGVINDRYYIRSFPTTFFVDSKGILRAQHIGGLDEALIYQYLEAAGYQP
jgi:cytochrome c biogenesis protein CcmG, thiol:disulfide interchange protein DsbE